MADAVVSIEVRGPHGEVIRHLVREHRVSVGRDDPDAAKPADIRLTDPDGLVSRHHCDFERRGNAWWVVDAHSTNGTSVDRGDGLQPVDADGVRLRGGDVVHLHAGTDEAGAALYWELRLFDPRATKEMPKAALVELDGQVYREAGGRRLPVELSPTERIFLLHLFAWNRDHGGRPTTCPHRELQEVVHTNLAELVFNLRRKIEPAGARQPRHLLNERGVGYRLVERPGDR